MRRPLNAIPPRPRPPSRARRRAVGPALALVLALLVAACSSGGGSSGSSSDGSGDKDALVVQVAGYDFAVGPPSRFTAGVNTADQRQVVFGTVEMRFSYLGTKAPYNPSPPGPPVTATFLPVYGTNVPTPPPSEASVVATSLARGVYAAPTAFDRAGVWQVEVTARVNGRDRKATAPFPVTEQHVIPAPGDMALPTENLTVPAPPDVPQAAIDSRVTTEGHVPDPELHRTTIAAALAAHRPAVVVFATPVFCVSRFCGPVTDLVQELSHTYGDRATFIHVEIWRDFQNHVLNKSAADWLFRNDDLREPWVYVIGADGRIVARFDNVVTQGELEPLIRDLPVIGPAA